MEDSPRNGFRCLLNGTLSHKVQPTFSTQYTNCRKTSKKLETSYVRAGINKYMICCNRTATACEHILPPVGHCLIVREKESKLILFPTLGETMQYAQLCLYFEKHNDMLPWEKKLRKHLKVYSFSITICPDQIFSKGDRVLHFTKDFIALSQYKNGSNAVVYQVELPSSTVYLQCASDELGILVIKSCSGPVDRIQFTSKFLKAIRDHLHKFQGDESASDTTDESIHQSRRNKLSVSSDPSSFASSTSASSVSDTYLSISEVAGLESEYLEVLPPSDTPFSVTEEPEESVPPLPPRPLATSKGVSRIGSVPVRGRECPSAPSCHVTSSMQLSSALEDNGNFRYQPLLMRGVDDYTSLVKGPILYKVTNGFASAENSDCTPKGRYVNIAHLVNSMERPHNISCRSLAMDSNPLAPPIPPRNRRISLGKPKKVNISLYLFGAKAPEAGYWSFAVLLTQSEDEKTFQRLKSLESMCGNELLTRCRALVATGDLVIKVEEASTEFKGLSAQEQRISFGDIDTLSPLAWITLEYHFLCSEVIPDHFQAQLIVKPAKETEGINTDEKLSQLTSQNIMVRKVFSKQGEHVLDRAAFRLSISLKDRIQFCQKLDFKDPMGKDWRWFAGELGLTVTDIQTIEHNTQESFTEQVLRTIERRKSEYCNVSALRTIIEGMRRLDVLENLVDEY